MASMEIFIYKTQGIIKREWQAKAMSINLDQVIVIGKKVRKGYI
jgi:hypothetical protein